MGEVTARHYNKQRQKKLQSGKQSSQDVVWRVTRTKTCRKAVWQIVQRCPSEQRDTRLASQAVIDSLLGLRRKDRHHGEERLNGYQGIGGGRYLVPLKRTKQLGLCGLTSSRLYYL